MLLSISINDYIFQLQQEEKSKSTLEQYERNIRRFADYLKQTYGEDNSLSKEHIICYKVDLGSITYTEAGEYHYTLTEVNGKEEGWIYDQREYELVMTVYEKDGNLTSYFNIYLDGELTEHILFQNTYENPEDPENPKDDSENPKEDDKKPENPKDDSEKPEDSKNHPEIVLPEDPGTEKSDDIIQTGDPVSVTRYMYMMIASLVVVMVILYRRGRRERI